LLNIHLVEEPDLLWLLDTHLMKVQGKVVHLDRYWLVEQGREVVDTQQMKL